MAEEGLAVAAAEQEHKTLRVGAQLREAIGGVADKVFQRWAEAGGVAVQPLAEELQHLGEFGGVGALFFGALYLIGGVCMIFQAERLYPENRAVAERTGSKPES